jgi:hypothetical protein
LEITLPTYRCRHIANPITIDGNLQKPEWQAIEPVMLQPVTGETAGSFQPTTFRACWTDSHLYLAFHCEDRDIWGTLTERDAPLYNEEVVEAFLCPTGDLRHYYEFEVSPRNVIFDATVYSPDLHRKTMKVDTSWECPGLEAAVIVQGTLEDRTDVDEWWSLEIAIPFAAFSEVQPPQPGDSWRANFYRIDRATPPEFTAWSPTLETPANFHVPERFGFLQFVK